MGAGEEGAQPWFCRGSDEGDEEGAEGEQGSGVCLVRLLG